MKRHQHRFGGPGGKAPGGWSRRAGPPGRGAGRSARITRLISPNEARRSPQSPGHSPRSAGRSPRSLGRSPNRPAQPITILCAGTHGDIAPFATLGAGLASAGCAVRLAAPPRFRALAVDAGLEFAPLGGNPTDLLAASPDALTLLGGPLRGLAASLRFLREARPVVARMLADAWGACRGSGAVIVSLPTLWGLEIAEALGVPAVVAPLQPLAPTRHFPSPMLPQLLPGLPWNALSHTILARSLRLPWRAELRRWRRESLGLPPGGDPLARAFASGVPFVHGYSPRVAPPPPDWPLHHLAAGYWALGGGEPTRELRAFVEAGEPPVYVGFGSMGGGDPEGDARLALGALALADRRGVILGGDRAARLAAGRSDVLVVPWAPHAWLLPRVAAAVHHGGAGTTGASLAAGAPTVIAPFAADQAFWGRRVAALGAGPPPVFRRTLTAERLAGAIGEATDQRTMRRAAALGELLRQERGVERAVEVILGAL